MACGYYEGQLERAIKRYKFDDRKGWARIFGRIIANRILREPMRFAGVDLIVANPTFVGPGGKSWDHVRLLFERTAAELGSTFPFDLGRTPAIVKKNATTAMKGKTWKTRKAIADGEIYPSLSVPNPALIRGKRVLVIDDLFTDGHTLRAVSLALTERGGAGSVCGLTLARAIYGG